MIRIFGVLLSFVAATAFATEPSLRPGGVAMVVVGETAHAAPTVLLDEKPVLVMPKDGQWVAVVGIPQFLSQSLLLTMELTVDGTERLMSTWRRRGRREQRETKIAMQPGNA